LKCPRRRFSAIASLSLATVLTIPLLSACWQRTTKSGDGLSTERGVLDDGRQLERLNESVGPGQVHRIEVIRTAQGHRLISVGMSRQQASSQGLETVSYERPERCLLTSRILSLPDQGQRHEEVVSSSCRWMRVGMRITVKARGTQKRPAEG